MISHVLAGLLAVVVSVLMYAALYPAEFRISRSIEISAPRATVFAEVEDLRRWERWSPYQKMDPHSAKTYSGPPRGPGAVLAWAGNAKVGEGVMTLTEMRPPERIAIRLDIVKPLPATNDVEFLFRAVGPKTVVTWAVNGRNNFNARLIGTFVDMDRMIGGPFEMGLAALKRVAEGSTL